MCYSGSCEYEYYMGDGETGCRKPYGEPCPNEAELEDALNEPGETEDD